MIEKNLKVLNEEGLHARPAGILAKSTAAFTSVIEISYNGKTVNAKSIMSLMGLGLKKDSEFLLRINGADEASALTTIEGLFNNKFHV